MTWFQELTKELADLSGYDRAAEDYNEVLTDALRRLPGAVKAGAIGRELWNDMLDEAGVPE